MEIQSKYDPDWLQSLDGRTAIAKAIRNRVDALESDLGGKDELSYQKQSLVKRAVWLEFSIEQQELALGRGEKVDHGKLTQAVNALIGVLKALGLERRVRKVGVNDWIASKAQESPNG